MSAESLQKLLERASTDAAFRQSLEDDPYSALQGFSLSPTELTALISNDEDGLRRLTGQDVAGHTFSSYAYVPWRNINPNLYVRRPSCNVPCATSVAAGTGAFVGPC